MPSPGRPPRPPHRVAIQDDLLGLIPQAQGVLIHLFGIGIQLRLAAGLALRLAEAPIIRHQYIKAPAQDRGGVRVEPALQVVGVAGEIQQQAPASARLLVVERVELDAGRDRNKHFPRLRGQGEGVGDGQRLGSKITWFCWGMFIQELRMVNRRKDHHCFMAGRGVR